MARARNNENKGLPARWRHAHGAYYYCVPVGQEQKWDGKQTFRLGKTLPEAYKVWAERLEETAPLDPAKTISQLLDRYLIQVVPTKALVTQKGNERHIKRLKNVFGDMPVIDCIKPKDVYFYYDKRESKVNARQEIGVLSHAFTMAVKWGLIDQHPFKGQIRLEGEKPRSRYIEDWEVLAALSLDSKRKKGSVLFIQAYISLKLLTGLRQTDLLRLQVSALKEDGIHVTPQKTSHTGAKPTIFEWSDELREAVGMAYAARPVDVSPYLFCNRLGQGYISEKDGRAHGFSSIWQRFMKRVMEETDVKERFTEHDLRAKAASDADSLERAQELLRHANPNTTRKFYRRKAERIAPLR